jgi:uncharacterized protein
MIQLTANEARALGVLIEKATTTPEQYPLSINALMAGCNQKNNRDPVLSLSEDAVFDAVEALREKQLAVRVDTAGSRVHKYRHEATNVLRVGGASLAVLGELLLRGPSTLGELRGRASRMHEMATLDDAKAALRTLMDRPEPLAKELPPIPGSRAERYAQLFYPDERATNSGDARVTAPAAAPAATGTDRVAALEREVDQLKAALRKLAAAVGEPDPLADTSVG